MLNSDTSVGKFDSEPTVISVTAPSFYLQLHSHFFFSSLLCHTKQYASCLIVFLPVLSAEARVISQILNQYVLLRPHAETTIYLKLPRHTASLTCWYTPYHHKSNDRISPFKDGKGRLIIRSRLSKVLPPG